MSTRGQSRSSSSDAERLAEWSRFFDASVCGYGLNALLAILDNDGEKTLARFLEARGLNSSLDLIRELSKRR